MSRVLRAVLVLSLLPLCAAHCSSEANDRARGAIDAGADANGPADANGDDGASSSDGRADSGAESGQPPSGALIVPTGTLWYIRPNGGTAAQCDGLADTDYPGSGSGQHCAFNHPAYLWSNDVVGEAASWKIAGGDTVILRGGPYRLGFKGPNAGDGWAYCKGDPYGCYNPPIPAGTATKTTKILGESFKSCTTKTELYGGHALSRVINLAGAENVDIACLELTDHASCTKYGDGTAPGASCHRDFPVDDYADNGLVTDDKTKSVSLIDLDIHGLTSRGIIGPIGGVITINHVRIGFNGAAGWDFDDGAGTKCPPGSLVNASWLTIEWSGCNEEYPIGHPYPALGCYDQEHAGYGDGVGTPNTVLDFTCDHCNFNHNTQDGFDFLHSSGSEVTIRSSISYANEGQQWKLAPMKTVVFENNVTIHDCKRMGSPIAGAPAGFNAGLGNLCRAANGAIVFGVQSGGTYSFYNNSLVGYADTDWGILCNSADCSSAVVNFANNLSVGFKSPYSGELPGTFYYQAMDGSGAPIPAFWGVRKSNLFFNPRSCPQAFTDERCIDPKLAKVPSTYASEDVFDDVDVHLLVGSPAIDTGIPVGAISTDYFGTPRPSGAAFDIGAAEHP